MSFQRTGLLVTHTKKETPADSFHRGKALKTRALLHSDFWGWFPRGWAPSASQWEAEELSFLPTVPGKRLAPLRSSHCEARELLHPLLPLISQVHAHVVWEVGGTAKQRGECPIGSPFTLRGHEDHWVQTCVNRKEFLTSGRK